MKIRIKALFLPAFLVFLLGGCDAFAETPQPRAETAAADGSGSAEQATAADEVPAMGCVSLRDWQAAGHGTLAVEHFRRDEEEGGFARQPWNVRLTLNRAGKSYRGEIAPRDHDPSTIVIGDEDMPDWTQVCLDHVFVVNLASERGGQLIVANQHGDHLIMSEYPYSSGDEDSALVRFRDGAINVVNSAEPGAPGWNLVEETDPDAAAPLHAYVPELLRCEAGDAQGQVFIEMPIDAAGQVRGLEYLSLMPSGTSCTVSAHRDDAPGDSGPGTLWSDEGDQTTIVWDDTDHPSTITITHVGDLYTIDAHGASGLPFCGQSSQLASLVKLRRGTPGCEQLQWPE